MQIIVGVSGASGAVYAVRLLEALRKYRVKTQLVVTAAAEEIVELEMGLTKSKLHALATCHYDVNDLTSPISSGSFVTDGMVVVPCSMKTLAGIACGYSSNLLLRAADVTLKERRPLVLVPRETPLNLIHLENMFKVAQAGAIVLPAMPGFYHKPKSIDDLVNHVAGKVLDVFHIEHKLYKRWKT
jgi:polyprenyl P-hydroxybenzoate/phenylacrylic acid decarboxylase-like protein